MFCIIQWKMRRSHSGSKKVESVTNCHGRSYLLVLKYPLKPLMRPAQPANVTASVLVTNTTTSLSLPIMPGIYQDYVTHTSDSVGRQKVASGYSFVPESNVEYSTWLANVMSDDRRHDVHPVTNTCSSLLPMPLMPGLQQDYLSHAVPAQMLGQSSWRQSHPPIMASTHTPLLQWAFSEPPSR